MVSDIMLSSCDEIFSAYTDVIKTVLMIRLVSHHGTKEFGRAVNTSNSKDTSYGDDSYEQFCAITSENRGGSSQSGKGKSSSRSALLHISIAQRAIYSAFLAREHGKMNNILIQAAKLDIDLTLSILEVLPKAWERENSANDLLAFSGVYIPLIDLSSSAEVRATALMHLAEVLDRLNAQSIDNEQRVAEGLQDLGTILQNGNKSPQLSVSEIRISGLLMIQMNKSEENFRNSIPAAQRLSSWGHMLKIAGHENNVRSPFR